MCPSQSANGDLGAIKSSAADPKSRTTTGLGGVSAIHLMARSSGIEDQSACSGRHVGALFTEVALT